ncbi:hypothetical protein C8A01DRAFT_31505 [Parachaetomium inaequale]|uniref:Uncharacterized protein n=1 Tax=Parachaetomium inaequale TaxID=2588326 RepID=A0AAN6SW54_9PEZI|nr:hypothetical protein C8A01DRAFT_31505 [Parachaetomium inaequale]
MDIPISTEYPKLQVADPTRPSLANLPLEIVLEILDALFKPEQIIRTRRERPPTQGHAPGLSPLLVPLRAEDEIVGVMDVTTWPQFKMEMELSLRWPQFLVAEERRPLYLPGYLVDERRLNDPIAFGWSRFRPAGGPEEDFSLLRAGL